MSGIMKIGLRYFQLVALAASFPLKWPSALSKLFDFMSITASASSAVLSTECTTGTDFARNAATTFLSPFLILFGIAAFWTVYAKVCAAKPVFCQWTLIRVELSILVALITIHPTLTRTTFQFFQCKLRYD